MIRGLTDQVNKKKYFNEDIEQAFSDEKKKNKELAKKIEEINEKYKKSKENIEEEFESLKDELDQAIEIITRQESSLQDLRLRKQEDDTKIFGLSKDLETKESEILKHQKMITKLNKNDQEKVEKIEDLEYKVRSLINENNRLKAELQCICEKQDKDRDERKKIAKKKIDLLTQRNQEILRLNHAFGTLDS